MAGLVLASAVAGAADDGGSISLLPPAWRPVVDELPAAENTSKGWFAQLPLQPRNRVDEAPWLFASWLGTGGLGLGLVGARTLFDGPAEASWHGGVLFDDHVRDAFRADSADGRETAADVSDVVAGSVLAWLVLDNALIQGRASQADAWRMTIDAFFAQGIVETMTKHVAGRERPDESDNRSFYSGHAALAATSAGLLCANHLGGELYGNRTADAFACGGAISAALIAGSLRIVADKHYFTDVLVGWGSGFVFGYLLPRRWYYGTPSSEEGMVVSLIPEVGRERASLVMAVHW